MTFLRDKERSRRGGLTGDRIGNIALRVLALWFLDNNGYSISLPEDYSRLQRPKAQLKNFLSWLHRFALPPSFSPLLVLTLPLHSHNSVSLSPCGDGSHAVCVNSWPDNSCPLFFSQRSRRAWGQSAALSWKTSHGFEPTNGPQSFLILGFSELPRWIATKGLHFLLIKIKSWKRSLIYDLASFTYTHVIPNLYVFV